MDMWCTPEVICTLIAPMRLRSSAEILGLPTGRTVRNFGTTQLSASIFIRFGKPAP
jgi:hypothetical protein